MTRKFVLFCKIMALLAFFGITTLILLIIMLNNPQKPIPERREKISQFNAKFKFNGSIYVHLDLKGAPAKIDYYKYLFSTFSSMNITGVVIEYEDTFPFDGLLQNISARNSYSKNDIETINRLAFEHKLEIIPMVQILSRLDYVLKIENFENLREVREYPRTMCPSNEQSAHVVLEIIEQIMTLHPKSRAIHIGTDDVSHVGRCDVCKTKTNDSFRTRAEYLFVTHARKIRDRIKRKYPNVDVLMWDEELRLMSKENLKKHFSREFIPVVSKFERAVYDELGPSLWDIYRDVFPKVWIATIFRGAKASEPFLADRAHYIDNHRSWLKVLQSYYKMINFEAVIITGWQRYNHFSVLTELIPISLPTLLMSIGILRGYNDSPMGFPLEGAKLLKCEQPYALMGLSFGTPNCDFPGGEILNQVHRLHQLKLEIANVFESDQIKNWMSPFHIANSYSDPEHILDIITSLNPLKQELIAFENDLSEAMALIYDKYTISEWKLTYIQILKDQVDKILNAGNILLSKNNWPRNPVHFEK